MVLPQSLNPIIGSFEGRLLGVSELPRGFRTYAGGGIVLAASAVVLVASHLRTRARPQASWLAAGTSACHTCLKLNEPELHSAKCCRGVTGGQKHELLVFFFMARSACFAKCCFVLGKLGLWACSSAEPSCEQAMTAGLVLQADSAWVHPDCNPTALT